MRKAQNEHPVCFVVAGKSDAEFLHGLFKGSKWLGQLGNLPYLKGLSQQNRKPNLGDDPEYKELVKTRTRLGNKVRRGSITEIELKKLANVKGEIAKLKACQKFPIES